MTVMAPRNPRLPTVELVANRVCSERNPMPDGTSPTTWQHPETRLEERVWFEGRYQAVVCVHCGACVRAHS